METTNRRIKNSTLQNNNIKKTLLGYGVYVVSTIKNIICRFLPQQISEMGEWKQFTDSL